MANFVSLAEGTRAWMDTDTFKIKVGVPFYNGVIFHRVVPKFVIQGGSPLGTGTDGPGYKFPDEFRKGADGQLLHKHDSPGVLSMANSGDHSNGQPVFPHDERKLDR